LSFSKHKKLAIITGITGQDGAYLAQLLIKNDYNVIGLVRSNSQTNKNGLTRLGILEKLTLVECDLMDLSQLIQIIKTYRPVEIYNLAAQSSVSLSFTQPIGTFSFNTISVFNLLEAIKLVDRSIRLYHASSSEMYGKVDQLPIVENTVFHPVSPYATSKAAAHWTCINYREGFDIFVSCGILFNHESILRTNQFFVKKVITEAKLIKDGKLEKMFVGNIDIKRDFGYAPLYVKAMHLMMQHQKPDDFIICSGISISLREVIEYIFERVGVSLSAYEVDDKLYRPNDIPEIFGDSSKAKRELGWNYNMTPYELLDNLLSDNNYLNNFS
jgi:GDPmannose 4,6-dehydratase